MLRKVIVICIFAGIDLGVQAQCVMCKEAAGAETRAVGINEGILYLMAAPYLVMAAALLGYLWYRRRKRSAAD
jgi:hypothetical protein